MHPTPPAAAGERPRAAYLLLVLGGTLHLLLAVLAGLPGPFTCAAALWAVAGLYGVSELLNDRPAAIPAEAFSN